MRSKVKADYRGLAGKKKRAEARFVLRGKA